MSLVATSNSGWTTGFGNLLDKELGSWWRTRRWLVHLILWEVVITGFLVIIGLEGQAERKSAPRGFAESMEIFFQVGGFFGLIGAVLVTQGAIVGERNSGTAAWVLTKPTSRRAFVLTKFVAITASFLFLSLVVPAIASTVVCQIFWKTLPTPAYFLEALGIAALHQTFYIALTLMLGTLFQSRGPVGGIALGFWVAGNILPNFLPAWVSLALPWPLTRVAAAVSVWKPVPMPIWIPTAATAALTILFLVVALWRFDREEF
ncbi:MAG: ABC transporter permease subunit [Gemmatimonadetes bacterium]|nr:ABC transporter permease subunit [Gemmatimonadota bacterium]MCC7132032.1 ABC transporter permease subunit [Gemmatimonadales bacterium]